MARTRQKSIVSAGASARAVSSANARDRSPSSRCASASATANSARMMVMSATWAARRTPAATRSGVQRPAGQRLTQGAGSLERQATLRIATQGDLGLSHLVGARRPSAPTTPARVRRRWRRTGRAGPASRTPRDRAITCRFSAPLSTQRPLTIAAEARSTFTRVRTVSFGLDLSTHHVNCSTSSTNRRRSTRRWHHA